jgi:hypothetical protein
MFFGGARCKQIVRMLDAARPSFDPFIGDTLTCVSLAPCMATPMTPEHDVAPAGGAKPPGGEDG